MFLIESLADNYDSYLQYSLGEYVALAIGGVLTFDDALRLVVERARLIHDSCEAKATSMLAVRLQSSDLAAIMESDAMYKDLVIACFNR